MGIPNGANRVVYSGTLCGGLETWAFSLWFTDLPSPGHDYSTGEPATATYLAWRAAFLALMRPEDAFTQLDSYYYSGGVAVAHNQATFSHPGTASAATLPPQCACVMTLRTALATRSGRGRIYLPYRGAAVNTPTPIGDSTKINATVDALAAYLTAENTAHGSPTAAVCSQTLAAMNAITAVDADLVIDTQRRRRDSITSSRHRTAVT